MYFWNFKAPLNAIPSLGTFLSWSAVQLCMCRGWRWAGHSCPWFPHVCTLSGCFSTGWQMKSLTSCSAWCVLLHPDTRESILTATLGSTGDPAYGWVGSQGGKSVVEVRAFTPASATPSSCVGWGIHMTLLRTRGGKQCLLLQLHAAMVSLFVKKP